MQLAATHHAVLDEDFALADPLKAGDGAQQGGLATAAGAEQATDVAVGQAEADALDDGGGAVGDIDVVDFKQHVLHRDGHAIWSGSAV